ncbi:unnamed protein product [Polarella glacialis]|uniref:Uncharacterized protein n=1 Tax=Polarella glacialis TaxID=89957 RepID=A0A813EFU7_POLGL|nr:unnamed protein product [Polarella glacialis]
MDPETARRVHYYNQDGRYRHYAIFEQRLPHHEAFLAPPAPEGAPGVPGPALSADGNNNNDVAVLFAGDWRFSRRTAAAISQFLVRPLRAAVFAVMSGDPVSDGSAERGAMQTAFPSLFDFVWMPDISPDELEVELRKSGSLPLYQALGGVALGPVSSGGSSALQALRKLQAVLDIATKHEAHRRQPWKWLVFSRTDLVWVAPHPPISLLDPRAIWISNTTYTGVAVTRYAGLNDWHAAVPRSLANAYFGRWSLIISGQVPCRPGQDPEELLGSIIHVLEVPVGLFAAVASLERCDSWNCAWKGWYGDRRNATHRFRFHSDEEDILNYAPGLRSGALSWASARDGSGDLFRLRLLSS